MDENIDPKNFERLDHLEKKWLDGNISKEEMLEYANWYNKSQNETVYVPESIASNKEEHKQNILNTILSKTSIKKDTPIRKTKQVTMPLTRWMYGSVAIVMVCFGILFLYNAKNADNTIAKPNIGRPILPGHNGMTLSFEDGEKIILDNLKDGKIVLQNGITLLKNGDQLSYLSNKNIPLNNTASTQKGQQYRIILPDGSKVYLNSESSLKYPIAFAGKERIVELKGEAYFEVAHNNAMPFKVKVNGATIEDIGTHFNVNGYTDEDATFITLLEGKIAIDYNKERRILSPNEEVSFSPIHSLKKTISVDSSSSVAWTRNEFSFNNATIPVIVRRLERWYDIQVTVENNVDLTTTYSGGTPMNQDLHEVLKVLSISGIHYRLEGNRLFILH